MWISPCRLSRRVRAGNCVCTCCHRSLGFTLNTQLSLPNFPATPAALHEGVFKNSLPTHSTRRISGLFLPFEGEKMATDTQKTPFTPGGSNWKRAGSAGEGLGVMGGSVRAEEGLSVG